MDRQFGKGPDKGKSEFLRKKKQQKAQMDQKERQIKATRKIIAFIRRIQQYKLFVKPFFEDSMEKVQLILQKRQDTQPEKYFRMISNVVYKMPFILQTLIFVRENNYLTHQDFLLALTQALVGIGHHNDCIRKVINNKGFAYIEIHKLLRFAVLLFDRNPAYEQLIVQFIAEAKELGMPGQIDRLLSTSSIKTRIRDFFLNNQFSDQNRQLILESVIFTHQQILVDVELPSFVNAILNVSITKPNLYEKVDDMLMHSNIFESDMSFLTKSNTLKQILEHTIRWLRIDLQRNQDSKNGGQYLSVPLFLHNRVLRVLEDRTVARISETFLPRKLINQLDEFDLRDLVDRVKRSTEYAALLETLNLQFYFGEMLGVFKRQLEGKNLKKLEASENLQSDLLIGAFCELYLLLGDIFKDKHHHKFQELSNRDFLLFLYGYFAKEDISRLHLNKQNTNGAVRLLQILVKYLLQSVSSMDDVEFASKELSFSPVQLQGIVLMLNSLIYELIVQPGQKNRQSSQLMEEAILLINDLYQKNFRIKLINPKIFELPRLNEELVGMVFDSNTHLEKLLKSVPFSFQFQTRLLKLRACIKEDKRNFDRELYHDDDHDQEMTVQIRRGWEFNDAFQRCYGIELRNKYKIVFTNQGLPEPGIDGGGIIKEFLNRVIKTAFDPLYGLFGETPLREIVPSPKETMSAETGKEYEFIGMIVGKAIYENILIEAKFSGPFLNLIIGRSNSLEDLKSLDPELYRSLISLKHANGNTQELGLTFSFMENGKVIELKEMGSTIAVTEYIFRLIKLKQA